MKEFESIKEYYKPIQPTAEAEGEAIIYQESHPSSVTENFVYCFWQLKTQRVLKASFIYRVVSDGCIDIFFEHKRPQENFVMGFCRKYTEFPIGREFDYIGIRFLPSAFPLLFDVDAKILSNKSQKLQQVLPAFSDWITTEIRPSDSFEKVRNLLNKRLEDTINVKPLSFDLRFFKSLLLIFKSRGNLDTEKDLNTGLSSRQLRRIFNFYIGTSAKAFSNVVRFQYLLNEQSTNRDNKNNKFYFDVGFFDQAHFIKNFKTFYGVTPTKAFR